VEKSQLVKSCLAATRGIVQESRGRGMSAVGSHYQRTGEDCD
jgi:hypothetical protein